MENEEENVDCNSEDGITIGLIDSLISTAKVLSKRDLNMACWPALKDLHDSEEMLSVMISGPFNRYFNNPDNANLLEAIRKCSAMLKVGDPWIRTEDDLPKEHLSCLIVYNRYGERNVMIAGYPYPKKYWLYNGSKLPIKYVTHWMPLPKAPFHLSKPITK